MDRKASFEKVIKNAYVTIDLKQRTRIWSLIEQSWRNKFTSFEKKKSFWWMLFAGLTAVGVVVFFVGSTLFRRQDVDYVMNELDKEIAELDAEIVQWDVDYDLGVEGYVFSN